jgi:hypothetical protein
MSQRDYDFYNDQTLNRKMVCTHEEEPLTVKDKRFKRDILQIEKADLKLNLECKQTIPSDSVHLVDSDLSTPSSCSCI